MRHQGNQQIEATWVPHAIGIIITVIDFLVLPVVFTGAWEMAWRNPILFLVYLIFLPLLAVPFWYCYYLYDSFRGPTTPPIPVATYRPVRTRPGAANVALPTDYQQEPVQLQTPIVRPMSQLPTQKPPTVPPVDEAKMEPIKIGDMMCGIPIESYIRFVVSKGYCDRQELKKQFKMTNAKADGLMFTLKSLGLFGPGNSLFYPVLLKPEALEAYFLPNGWYNFQHPSVEATAAVSMADTGRLEEKLAELERKIRGTTSMP